jgi:plastocyanin
MRTPSHPLLWVTFISITLTTACDFAPLGHLCFDWTDTGSSCNSNGGGDPPPFYYNVEILPGAADNGSAAFAPDTFMTTVAAATGAYPPVTWMNYDSAAHHIVSDTPLFDTGVMTPNVYVNFKFTTAGTFKYHCAIHPTMVGTIIVNP